MTANYSKIEKTNTEFHVSMPSGTTLLISLYDYTPKVDIEFVERLIKSACESKDREYRNALNEIANLPREAEACEIARKALGDEWIP